MASKRSGLSKKTRFEVFKRDSFTCQYCGRSAPDVVLEVDHIQPVAKAGDDDILNLVTSCRDCNAGKKDRELSDDAVIQKRQRQLAELQDRREQLAMMLEWQASLADLDNLAAQQAAELWHELCEYYTVNDNGLRDIKKWIRKFTLPTVFECMRLSAEQYIVIGPDGKPTADSVVKAFEYIGRIAANRERTKDKPYMRDLYYIRGILRNRLNYLNEWACMQYLEDAYKCGVEVDELQHMAKEVKNWTDWRLLIENRIEIAQSRKA